MNARPLAIALLLVPLAACDKTKEAPALYDVQLKHDFANDFATFTPPSPETIKSGSIAHRLTTNDYDQAWQALLAVAAQSAFIAHADKTTGTLICAALPPMPHGKSPARPDPFAYPPPAFLLERRANVLILHANWNVPCYTPLKSNGGLALKDTDTSRISALFFEAIETQARSDTRWPWLTNK